MPSDRTPTSKAAPEAPARPGPGGRLTELFAGFGSQQEGRGVPLLPWALVGLGVFVAWLCCTHLPNMFVYARDGSAGEMAVDYGMRVGDIGLFVAVAALGRRLGPVSSHRALCVGSIALCAVGTLALPCLAVLPGMPLALLVALSAASAVGGAVLFLLWAEAYVQLGSTRCLLFGALSCLVAGAVALVVSNMGYGASCVAVALLPLLSGIMAAVSLSRLPGERVWRMSGGVGGDVGGQAGHPLVAGQRAVSYPVPWKLVVLMALAGFASGFAGSLLVDIDGIGAVHRVMATALFGALLLVAFVARSGDVDVRYLAWVTLPVAVVSFALIPLVSQQAGLVVSFLVKLSYVAFALFVLLMLANVCHRCDIPSARVFAAGRASSEAAMFAGILLRRWMRAQGVLDGGEMLWLIALIGLVATVGCVLIWHSERSVTSDWGVCGIDAASGLAVKSPREQLLESVEALSAEHGLTPREKEILSLIAQGEEAPAIEGELFLSHNTLKTHLRHIYAKLGVHTRAEALELLGVGAQ